MSLRKKFKAPSNDDLDQIAKVLAQLQDQRDQAIGAKPYTTGIEIKLYNTLIQNILLRATGPVTFTQETKDE